MNDIEIFEKVRDIFENEIKGIISLDGGKIELVSVSKGTVFVRFSGACKHCPAIDYTMKNVVERIIFDNFEEIISVETV